MKSLTLSEIILCLGALSFVFVVFGILTKTYIYPIKGQNSFYLFEDLSENFRHFILALLIFESSALYFVNHFDFGWWQEDINWSVAALLIAFGFGFASFIGILIFGFLCTFPTPSWFRAKKALRPTDVWCDFDK